MTSDTLGDEAVLAGLALNDPEATAAFIRRFQGKVFGVALSLLGAAADAEDVAQQAFERAWRHADMYDPRRGSVQAWLLTITRNLAIDQLRSTSRLGAGGWDLAGELESPALGPEDHVLAADAATRLRAAIAALPPEQGRALELAAFRGLSAPEIAEAEQVPLGTAKSRVRVAMIKLRAALGSQQVEP